MKPRKVFTLPTANEDPRLNSRLVINVAEDNPQDPAQPPPYGWVVVLSCGHRYWTPVNVAKVGDRRMCAECITKYIEEAQQK